jgi:hypothetical protein
VKRVPESLWALARGCAIAGVLAATGCMQGAKAGTLVGDYSVRGVLVENTCGQTALPAANPLMFALELREDQGIGYWIPDKAPRNTGSLGADGSFRFALAQTQVISQSTGPAQLEPGDFLQSPDTNFDIKKSTCAVTMTQTVMGKLQRRRAADGSLVVSADDAGAATDLTADNLIAIAPTAGSDCNPALIALGGSYQALPCQARYELHGELAMAASSDKQ